MGHQLRIKRVYKPPEDADGVRVLVDRLWPRGLSKERARIDLWLKEIAPSNTLRRLFHGNPESWEEFKAAYCAELDQPAVQSAVRTRCPQMALTSSNILRSPEGYAAQEQPADQSTGQRASYPCRAAPRRGSRTSRIRWRPRRCVDAGAYPRTASLVISLASAAGVIWIYFAHLLEIYKALSKKTIYRGPSIKEIAVAGAKRLPSRTTGRFAASIPAVVPVTTAARLE
jgi:uncharacterized protein YeaO (DUF488 family)